MESLNRPITNIEMKSVMKTLLTKKSWGSDGFTDKFYQTFKELIVITFKQFQTSRMGRVPSYFNLWGQHYLDTKVSQKKMTTNIPYEYQ